MSDAEPTLLANKDGRTTDLARSPTPKTFGFPLELFHCDGSTVETRNVIGVGGSGIIQRYGGHVLKSPILMRYPEETDDDEKKRIDFRNRRNFRGLQHERTVYFRLQNAKGVVKYMETTPNGIVLEYCPGSDLQRFLEENAKDNYCQTKFIFGMIDAVVSCHSLRVLVTDIALRNFVIASDQSIKIIDFSCSEVYPLQTDMRTVVQGGQTVKSEIFSLACAIYSVSAWRLYSFEHEHFEFSHQKDVLPPIRIMPSTEDVMYGHIIKRCWQGHYSSMEGLRWALRAERLRLGLVSVWEHCLRVVQHMF